MKKLFLLTKTLLVTACLLMGASSAWADDVTIFSAAPTAAWSVPASTADAEITSSYATISGGKMYLTNQQTSTKDMIKKNGEMAFQHTNNNTFFKVVLDKALEAGDVISVRMQSRTDADLGLWFSTASERPGSEPTSKIVLATDSKSQWIAAPTYTVTAGDGIIGEKTFYIYRHTGKSTYFNTFKITREVTVTSETLKSSAAVKVGESTLTLDAATNGYSVSTNTITLSDDVIALSIPDNIKLIKTITYSDSSTKDEEVDVTFDGTVTAGYYIGTASIGLTGSEISYTVRIKKAISPTAVLDATSGSIALTESWKFGIATVTLTGANLTDGEYDVTADVTGMTITPATFTVASGSVNQEFTITSTEKSAATTVFTFGNADMGVAAPTYTITYSQSAPKRNVKQTDVTSTTTWDWTKAGTTLIELKSDGTTSPASNEEFLMAELPEITNNANFNSQALKVICQFPTRGDYKYFQGNSIKFTTTVPGTVVVTFSNTGSRDDNPAGNRYIYINGVNTGKSSYNTTMTSTDAIAVPAGEVVINAFTGEDAATMVRINKIVFTELATAEVNSTYGWSTFVSDKALDFTGISGVKAYIVTGHSGNAITTTQMTGTVPANTPLLLEGATTAIPVAASSSTDVSANLLKAGTGAAVSAESGKTKYVLSAKEGNAVFKKINATAATVPAGKAYLEFAEEISAPELDIVFNGDVTGISSIDNGQLTIDNYFDLQGRKVMNPAKGLYIVNGRKVIIK